MQRDPSAETSSPPAESRETQIRSVVYEYLSRTTAGEPATPDQYHERYPGLMPELAEALLLGAKNLRTLMDAERAMLAEPLPSNAHYLHLNAQQPMRWKLIVFAEPV